MHMLPNFSFLSWHVDVTIVAHVVLEDHDLFEELLDIMKGQEKFSLYFGHSKYNVSLFLFFVNKSTSRDEMIIKKQQAYN